MHKPVVHLRALLAFLALTLVGCATAGGPSRTDIESPATHSQLEQLAAEIVDGAVGDREKAILIYEFVRDEVEYGFTPRFDAADPLYTLSAGRGHCNPQTTLFVALARAAGLEARQHFVTISDDILDDVFPKRAPRSGKLDHSFAEIRIDGRWLRVDGYAVDAALLAGAQQLLRQEDRVVGFAAHRDSCHEWDGRSDCMAQFASPDLLEPDGDHGAFEDPSAFYETDSYSQRMSSLTRVLYRWFGMRAMNQALDEIREVAWADESNVSDSAEHAEQAVERDALGQTSSGGAH